MDHQRADRGCRGGLGQIRGARRCHSGVRCRSWIGRIVAAADQGQALVEGVDYRPGRARRSRGARGESPSGERPENAVQLSEQGALWHRLGDRKSGGSGKSVSVSVDIGGCRIIKKKKKKKKMT